MTGCENKRENLKYDGKNIDVVFQVNKDCNYKVSTDYNDFITVREKAMLIGKKFKIGIEEDDNLSLPAYEGKFSKFMEHYSNEPEFKKTNYSNINGFQKFDASYIRYEVYIPVNNHFVLKLNIYSNKNTPEATKQYLNSKEVQDILNNVTIKKKGN